MSRDDCRVHGVEDILDSSAVIRSTVNQIRKNACWPKSYPLSDTKTPSAE